MGADQLGKLTHDACDIERGGLLTHTAHPGRLGCPSSGNRFAKIR
jgi:hypothetical protein